MATIHITDQDFEEKVLKSDKPVLVDFWAPWCGPCRAAEPILETLSEKYKDTLVIAKMNVDENTQNPVQLGVMGIPTVIGFKDGKEVDRKVGFGGEQGYEELIKKLG